LRRLVALSFTAVLLAACSGNPPSETPIRPWSPPTGAPTPGPTSSRICATSASADTSTWTAFAPAGEGFSVLLPGQPEAQASTIDTEAGQISLTIWNCVSSSGWAMVVMRARGTFEGAPDPIFDSALQLMASQSNATIQSQAPVTVGGRPGRAFVMTGQDLYMSGQLVLAGDDLYGAYFASPSSADESLARAFLATFSLTD
jgi:hypothetical protein